MYTPKPIDTSDIKLPEELLQLTERIAANVHDVWACGRISEGWIYGEVKDPEKKQPHCLFLMMSFQNQRRTMIEILPWKH